VLSGHEPGSIASSKTRHALVVRRLRELGLERIVYGSDAEFRMIEANVAPCTR
jgi:hypothetical protein